MIYIYRAVSDKQISSCKRIAAVLVGEQVDVYLEG
jgi:hypothetical protein